MARGLAAPPFAQRHVARDLAVDVVDRGGIFVEAALCHHSHLTPTGAPSKHPVAMRSRRRRSTRTGGGTRRSRVPDLPCRGGRPRGPWRAPRPSLLGAGRGGRGSRSRSWLSSPYAHLSVTDARLLLCVSPMTGTTSRSHRSGRKSDESVKTQACGGSGGASSLSGGLP